MVSTIEIKPAPLLQPFISCYALREFNTGEATLPKPMHAVHEYYMTFFLKDKFCELRDDTGKMKEILSSTLITFLTKSHGSTCFKGNYSLFHVQVKSNGLFAIFGIPQKLLIDNILPIADLLGNDYRIISEQLESSKDIYEMSIYMNTYFIKKLLLQNHKSYTKTVAAISNIILKNKGVVSVDKLALYANMSFRNFERRFVNEVGLPPKLYARITRFYNAIENKMLHSEKSWTDVAYEFGYFDQAHLIKEVKTFSSKPPDELFKYTPPVTENFIEKVEH
jgi:AraC-like DNA-binding protein